MLEIKCPHCKIRLKFDESEAVDYEERNLLCAGCHRQFQYTPPGQETNTVELPAFLKATINMVADSNKPLDHTQIAVYSETPALDKRYRYTLEVTSGMDKGRQYPIHKPRIVLGRNPEMDIQLKDVGISRKHATLEIIGDRVMLTDHNSHNGSFIGQERIKTASLQDDLEFTLAVTSLQLHLDGPIDRGRIGLNEEDEF